MNDQPTALAPIAMGNRGIAIRTMDELARFAECLEAAQLLPKGLNPAGAMICIQMGLEVGLSPMQAIQNVAVINGRPTVWGDSALALCKAHPDFEYLKEWSENGTAWCEMKRRNEPGPVKRSFSVDQAKKAGLWGKAGPWQTYPDRMLQMRARGFAMRDCLPDALRGMYIREEIDDRTIEGAQATEFKELPSLAETLEKHGKAPESPQAVFPAGQKIRPGRPPKAKAEAPKAAPEPVEPAQGFASVMDSVPINQPIEKIDPALANPDADPFDPAMELAAARVKISDLVKRLTIDQRATIRRELGIPPELSVSRWSLDALTAAIAKAHDILGQASLQPGDHF